MRVFDTALRKINIKGFACKCAYSILCEWGLRIETRMLLNVMTIRCQLGESFATRIVMMSWMDDCSKSQSLLLTGVSF